MGGVGMNLKVPATKGSLELNQHNLDMPKEVRHGRGLSEEDKLRINEDVNGGRRIELVKYHDAMQSHHQQAQGPVVQWERFLPLRSLKVLLVESDDSTRHVVSALLRNCSYEVTAVANGLEAWKVLVDLNKQIDLVLTEVVMPYLSGVGLLSKIMTHVPRKNIPVIMMSSDDSMGIVFNCLSKGAVDFLVKPIRKNELKNLWQHVWRKCHSSSGSGSESGIQARKSTKSRRNKGLDDDSNSDEDDDRSIAVAAKDGSDNGSGTQSFSSKRAVEVDSSRLKSSSVQSPVPTQVARHTKSNSYLSPTTTTRDYGSENEKQDTAAMGKDLEIGVSKSSGVKTKDSNKKVDDKSCESNLKKVVNILDTEKPYEPRTEGASVMLAPERSNAHREAVAEAKDLLNNINIEEKSTYHAKESPALELSLKRPRDEEDNETTNQERNVLRHSGLSAFSRYNTISNTNQDPIGNIGSSSLLNISSEAAKPKNIQSNSNGNPNQRSNGSSNDNDMGSTTNNAFTKPEALKSDKTINHNHNPIPTLELLVPSTTNGDTVAPPRAVHHHHHYHHYHHHVHKQQMADNDDGSLRNMVSNVLTTSAEGNAANYGSATGSNNKSNGENGGGVQKGSSLGAMAEGGEMGGGNGGSEKCRAGDGNGSGSGSGVDQERLAQREAALYKFRQKRKDRCFEKKVRYQSRKKLAEERPRVRGQFVRQGANGIQNKDADS